MSEKKLNNHSAMIDVRDPEKIREKIKQAVRESNLDQQEILKRYKRKFSTVR